MVDIGASIPSVPALASFKQLVKTRDTQLDVFARQATMTKDVAYLRAQLPKIANPEELVKSRKLLTIITSAFGLDGEEQFPGRVRKVLESDLKDPRSFANRTVDPRYKQLAEAFKFAQFGDFYFKNNLGDIANRYVRNEFEKSLGQKNPALREAAYFLRTIGDVKDTYQILGDKVLRSVVTTALGLPANIAVQSIETQKRLIEARLDITKFQLNPDASAGGTTAKSPLDLAQAELTSITGARKVVTGAQGALNSILERIQGIKDEYDRLEVIQDDVSGPYAAEIPVQEAAAPELLRQKGLLAAAQEALGRVGSHTARLQQLIQLAGNPETDAAELAEYKTEFADLKAKIEAAISGATYAYDASTAGASFTAQNLIGGGLPGTLSVQYKAAGDATSVRTHNLGSGTSFDTFLDSADAAFQAITGSGDSANITAASSALSSAKSLSDTVKVTVDVDATLFGQAIDSVSQWAGTYNTAGTLNGAEALRDAGSRVTDINQILAEMRSIAQDSALRDSSADRSDLTARYGDLLTELSDAIGTVSANNLLAGTGHETYTLIGGSNLQARRRDLDALVHDVLNAGNVGDVASANAVVASLDGSVKTTMETTAREIGIDSSFFNLAADTLDPRAAVDSLYRKLSLDMEQITEGALVDKKNLLDDEQSAIKLALGAAGVNITVSAKTDFDTNVADLLAAGAALLPSDALDASGALAKLEEVRFNAARILSQLNDDGRKLDNAKALTDNRIKDLEAKAETSSLGGAINASAFAIKLVEKYLAFKDQQAASALGGFGTGNAYLTQLIQPLKPRGSGFDFSA
jgi:hypothetical protein